LGEVVALLEKQKKPIVINDTKSIPPPPQFFKIKFFKKMTMGQMLT
jgi:hypothetical protein